MVIKYQKYFITKNSVVRQCVLIKCYDKFSKIKNIFVVDSCQRIISLLSLIYL